MKAVTRLLYWGATLCRFSRATLAIALALAGFLGSTHSIAKELESMHTKTATAIVNKYLNIMLVENNQGRGLETILSEDFTFADPFGKASSAAEFIGNGQTQRWIATRKSFRMQRQFADGNHVCSVYVIDVVMPSAATASFEVVDLIEIRSDRIAKEKVYFANPVQFAKEMGFLSEYLKQF